MSKKSNPEIIKKEIGPGIILITEIEKYSEESEIIETDIYKIQSTSMSTITFTINFQNSQNIHIDNLNENENSTTSTINPFETKEITKVNILKGGKLSTNYTLTLSIPDKSEQEKYIIKDIENLNNEINNNKNLYSNISFEHLSKEEIEKILKNNKFIDYDFLPNDNSFISEKYDNNIKEYLEYLIHWRRPEEFILNDINNPIEVKEIKVFNSENSDPEPNEIIQGILPDNHLESVFSALSEKHNLIRRLFKNDIYNKNGIYQVKLCVNGEWVTVIIDDLIPCFPKSYPMVSRCKSNNIWILILEKALAKIYGCYYNLTALNIFDFFNVLTGCPTYFFSINDALNNGSEDDLFNNLFNYTCKKKYINVAVSKERDQSKKEEDNLLTIVNFGYYILNLKKIKNDMFIILRKVWDDGTKNKLFKEYEINLINDYPELENDLKVATLIMKFKDFIYEFSSYAVCYISNWNEVRIRGKFVLLKEEINVISKWYYYIKLEKKTNIIISLFQDEDKFKEAETRKNLLDIALTILIQDKKTNEISHYQSLEYNKISLIQIELNLEPGNYIILPRTSGCFFGRPQNSNEENTILFDKEKGDFTPIFKNTILDIFKKFDLLLNQKLMYNEFKGFYSSTMKEQLDENNFNNIYLKKYSSYEGGITEKGFIQLFKETYINEGEEKIRKWLFNLGYDNDLYPLRSRNFMLTFHSNNQIIINVRDNLGTDLNSKINQITFKNNSKEIFKNGDVSVFQYQSKGSDINSFGCFNYGNIALNIILSFDYDDNIIVAGNVYEIQKVVSPNSYEFFANVYNDNDRDIKFNLSYNPIE